MMQPSEAKSKQDPAGPDEAAGVQPAPGEARFEAMLRQVLTTDEEARERRSAKDRRTVARYRAVDAKARSERERGPRSRRPEPGKPR
jgi:hypothetical protein